MQCIFLFRDAQGRLPTAGELRARGFVVSEAVRLPDAAQEPPAGPRALAAEAPLAYGGKTGAAGGTPGAGPPVSGAAVKPSGRG